MKKIVFALFVLIFSAGLTFAGMSERVNGACEMKEGKRSHNDKCMSTIAKFGIITDIHHTNKDDSTSRKYSASLAKTEYFVKVMNHQKADFVIELGDIIDTLSGDKDPVENFNEVESIFTSFDGPQYHVLGNHEFDNIERSVFLPLIDNTDIPEGETYYSFDQNGIHCIVLDADYTVAEPHRAFDMQTADDSFWTWKDAWIPQEELDWLADDLAASNLPTVIFTHQVVHRDTTEDHTIKNADVLRSIFETDGQVIAVFSGHDHRGELAFRNGIHYLVLEGNVGMSLDWPNVSPTDGLDAITDSPFSLIEIFEADQESFNGMKTYKIKVAGNAQQYTFEDQVQIVAP